MVYLEILQLTLWTRLTTMVDCWAQCRRRQTSTGFRNTALAKTKHVHRVNDPMYCLCCWLGLPCEKQFNWWYIIEHLVGLYQSSSKQTWYSFKWSCEVEFMALPIPLHCVKMLGEVIEWDINKIGHTSTAIIKWAHYHDYMRQYIFLWKK